MVTAAGLSPKDAEAFSHLVPSGMLEVVHATHNATELLPKNPAPSAADAQVTRQLLDAAWAVDIELLDHVVLGRAECDPQGLGYLRRAQLTRPQKPWIVMILERNHKFSSP